MSTHSRFSIQGAAARSRGVLLLALLLVLLLLAPGSQAQPERRRSGPTLSQQQTEQALAWLAAHAPIILSGEVLAIDTANPAISFTTIRVDRAIRGVRAGEAFRFGQWHGAELEPLQAHQRVILFLHGLNPAGVSSVVGGSLGLLTLGGGARVNIRSLQLFGAQRYAVVGAAAGGPPVISSAAFPGEWRSRLRVGLPSATFTLDGNDTMPAQQIFAAIAALVLQQRQHEMVEKEAVHGR